MKRMAGWSLAGSLVVVFVLVAGCRPEMTHSIAKSGGGNSAMSLTGYEIGEPLSHGNLTIFPVSSKEPLTDDRFITLDEGLKSGTVKVFEMGAENGQAENPGNEDQTNAPPELPPSPPGELNADFDLNPGGPETPSDNDPRTATPQPPVVEDVEADTEPADADPFGEPTPPDATTNEVDDEAQQTVTDNQTDVAAETSNERPQDNSPPWGNAPSDRQQVLNVDGNLEDFDLSFSQNAIQQRGNFSGGREVNRLMVVNSSDKPLYLMPGEIIIGGSQDRTIGQELVIAPTGKPIPVDVFCVEQQRWHDRDAEETVAQLAAASSGHLRETISVEEDADADVAVNGIPAGKFIASVGNLNKGARLALNRSKEQGEVWNEVAKQNAKTMVAGESATFSANYADADFVSNLEPFVKTLQQPIADHENVIGVIVAVNGKVDSMDMFESTPLFKKLWPKLLKSYALDAATHAVATDKDDAEAKTPPKATIADARAFFQKATSGEVTKSEKSGDLAVVASENDDVICFTSRRADVMPVADQVLPSEGLPADLDAFGGFGGVHTSAFSQ